MDHLAQYQVDQHPVHYIPNFITEDEEATLMRKIESSPSGKWRNLPNRRLQVWGGDIAKSGTLIPQELPAFVTTFPNLLEKLRLTGAFSSTSQGTVNHIILNEYLPGQGITPHQDGPAYHPVVATLSLASHTVMEYYQYQADQTTGETEMQAQSGKIIDPTPILRLLLEPRSLVITHGHFYTKHLHGISGSHYDVFIPSSNGDSSTLGEKYKRPGYETQVIFAREIANRKLLGSEILRDRFAEVADSKKEVAQGGTDTEEIVCLERQTRTSLTCRVVEKTSNAVGKLLKLR